MTVCGNSGIFFITSQLPTLLVTFGTESETLQMPEKCANYQTTDSTSVYEMFQCLLPPHKEVQEEVLTLKRSLNLNLIFMNF